MTSLLLVPLDDTVVFPTMDVTLPVEVGDEERVLLIPRHDGAFAKVGTIAEVTESVRLPGGGRAVALTGVARGVAGAAHTDAAGRLRIDVTESVDAVPVDGRSRNAEREYRAVVEEILELRGADSRVGAFLRAIAEPGPLADTIGYAPDVTFEQKVEVLETLDVTERLELAVRIQRELGEDSGSVVEVRPDHGRRPRRAGGRQGPHRRVPGRQEAARGARDGA